MKESLCMRDALLVGGFAIVFAAPVVPGSIAIDSVEHSASAVIFGNSPHRGYFHRARRGISDRREC